MPIQGDLLILPKSNFLPLPWTVRGPLGLETGTRVSLGLVRSQATKRRLPDIIVSPLDIAHLHQTYTIDVTLGERAGAVADFLEWFGALVEKHAQSKVNIALAETNTIEGGARHKIHMIVEPIAAFNLSHAKVTRIVRTIQTENPQDIIAINCANTYDAVAQDYELEDSFVVRNGWINYNGWHTYIKERYKDILDEFDMEKIVASCSPDQRLIRYIIPRKGVIELKARHKNAPHAMKEIARATRRANYNILSLRLSRTPGHRDVDPSKSLIVVACEPVDDNTNRHKLRGYIDKIPKHFQISETPISSGSPAENSIYLIPRSVERVQLSPEMRALRGKLRADISHAHEEQYGVRPRGFVFLSRRFINPETPDEVAIAKEQSETVTEIVQCLAQAGIATVQAAEPERSSWHEYDTMIHNAVFSRLWASDACIVLALDADGSGHLSPSMGHEIGFFNGRAKRIVVLATRTRNPQAQFGNIIGDNRIPYAEYPKALKRNEPQSIFCLLGRWLDSLTFKE